MAIDVTVFVNNIIKNNPNVSANVRKGVTSATALFSALEGGQVNASTLMSSFPADADPKQLANAQKGIATITNLDSALSSGTIPPLPGIPGGVALTGAATVAGVQQQKNTNKNLGIEDANKQTFGDGASRDLLTTSTAPIAVALPKVKDSIPILLQSEVRALMMQIAWMETQNDFSKNADPRYGRYLIHNKTLINYGYKESDGKKYTGKGGITTDNELIFNNDIQDRILEQYIVDQYKALIKAGAIRDGDKKETIAGMIAVAYQFQDANPTLGGALSTVGQSAEGLISGGGESSGLVSAASGLTSSLTSSLSFGSGATSSTIENQLTNSGLIKSAQGLLDSNPVSISKSGVSVDKSLPATAKKVVDQAKTTATSVKDALAPELAGLEATAKKAAASVEVDKLKKSASEFASGIPAQKAKDWRETGKEKDSTGRSGSLFYNAGKYAIQVLSADINPQNAG